MEFGRRLTVEAEIDNSERTPASNVIFDESGNFILYSTMLGVKVVNILENKIDKILGKSESNLRFLTIGLYQGKIKGSVAAENLQRNAEQDPTLFCTAFKQQRFYMITRRDPYQEEDSEIGRDVFNERPSKAEASLLAKPATRKLGRSAILHTTMGDIHIKLFPEECPKTIENFTVHSKDGYYNNCIFHRVIKGFMIQTGDPLGDGTGGTSIWGHDFEDEFNRTLKHDRPFTVSMANCGPNTNGSQFFITTVPCPSLDYKHTVFGRVIKGTEVVSDIEGVKTGLDFFLCFYLK